MDMIKDVRSAARAGVALLIMIAMIFVCFVITDESAFAEADGHETTEDGWVYEDVGDGTIRITGYEGSEEDAVVPAMIGEKSVKEIGNEALKGNAVLTSIVVSEGITTIGEEAFADCPNLWEATLPDTVTSIGRRAFRYCFALRTCILPKTLQELPYQCFWECETLTGITVPEGVTTIPNGTFYNNFKLSNVTIPDSVTTIEKNAFHACTGMVALQLSQYIQAIDPTSFSDCEKLEISAPEGSYADLFAKENGYGPEPAILESEHPCPRVNQHWEYKHPTEAAALMVTFSDKTRFSIFWDDFRITDEAGNSYEYFGGRLAGKTLLLVGDSFEMDLTSFEDDTMYFGFRITKIEPMTAEEYQAYLDDIEAHPWLTRIVNGTLEITGYRAKHHEVTIPARIDGIPVSSIARKVFGDHPVVRKLTIEEGISTIQSNAFRSCEDLEEVILPDSVTTIGMYALADCVKLKKVTLPKNLKELNMSTFESCKSMEEITLPNGLSSISGWAFYDCENLRKVVIPDSVTSMGESVFAMADKVVIFASADSYAFNYAETKGLKAIDVPLAKNGQYADGTQKDLITSGKTVGGRLVYALGKSASKAPDASKYTESIPVGVEAKTYYVWYKMTDAAPNDEEAKDLTDPECIPVKLLGNVDRMEELIDALPEKITASDKAAVDAAVAAWLKLTNKEKVHVSRKAVKKLAAAEDAIYHGIAKARCTEVQSARRKPGIWGTKATVKWTKSSGASGYRIRYSTNKKVWLVAKTKKTSSTEITLKHLNTFSHYYVQVIPYTTVRNRVTGIATTINGQKSETKKISC